MKAQKMINSGSPLALATDYNLGSSPSGKMNLVGSLICIKLKIDPEEVFSKCGQN